MFIVDKQHPSERKCFVSFIKTSNKEKRNSSPKFNVPRPKERQAV